MPGAAPVDALTNALIAHEGGNVDKGLKTLGIADLDDKPPAQLRASDRKAREIR